MRHAVWRPHWPKLRISIAAQSHELIRDWNSRLQRHAFSHRRAPGHAHCFSCDRFARTNGVLLPDSGRIAGIVRGPKPAMMRRSRKVRIDRAASDPFTTHEVLCEA